MVNIFKRFWRFYKECLEAYGDDLCRMYAYKKNWNNTNGNIFMCCTGCIPVGFQK